MGRRKLDLDKGIVVRLPKGTAERIDALTNAEAVAAKEKSYGYQRAKFIRDAVEKELRRRENALERG